jgi:metallo-beta-lactamase family protein
MVKVKFLGAAGTVTGSKYLLQLDDYRILIDCGLFQGIKYLRNLNWDPLPIDISKIDVVLITHAHLDHTGYLPLLTKSGYKGKIYMTSPTAELAEIILRDSAKIQEEDAARANRDHFSKHNPALALYTEKDAAKCIKLFHSCEPDQWISLTDKIKIRYKQNAHILGSCFIEIDYKGKVYLFSGDVGRKDSLTLDAPLTPDKADVLFIESTYGNRLHPVSSSEDQLYDVIHDALRKKGNILISSFAIGRAQELLVLLDRMRKENKIPLIPVYLDSPMSSEVTKVMFSNPKWHKLSFKECQSITENVFFVKTVEDSYSVMDYPGSKIIIAASGMLSGGRILNYLERYLEDPKNTILLVGYQAAGTRGKALKEGAHELKVHGKYYRVNADVRELTALSAHADQGELIEWMKNIEKKPKEIFLVHGEVDALAAFQLKIKDELGWDAKIPGLNDEFEIV